MKDKFKCGKCGYNKCKEIEKNYLWKCNKCGTLHAYMEKKST